MKILLNEKQVIYVLEEALELSRAREYASIQRSPEVTQKINKIFEIIKQKYPNFRTSKRGDRLYVPFGSQLKDEIIDALQSNEFDVKDYDNGIVVNRRNGQETKLGKALTRIKREDLLTNYNTDKSKGAVSNPSGYMVFSKHQYDIAGMSTGRNWSSCMNLDTGSNKRYVSCDITEGSFVVYLIDSNDLNIKNPKGRMAIKPFVNTMDKKDVIFFPESRSYGSVPSEFKDEIDNFFKELNVETKGVSYTKSDKLYNDSASQNYTNLNKIKTPKDVENLIHNVDDRTIKELSLGNKMILDYVMKSPRINHYVKESIIDVSKYDDIKEYLTVNFLSGYASTGGLDTLLDHWPQVIETVMSNPKIFEKNFLSVLLKYNPSYISKVKTKDIRNLGDSQFYDVLHYNPEFFPMFYDKFKDKMASTGRRLVYFLEDNPTYIIKAYPIFRKIFREMSDYDRHRFLQSTLIRLPQLFNFYLYNEKNYLDNFFEEETNRNENVMTNNKLFYLVHSHYPKFIDELVFHQFLRIISRNESLIPFMVKFYRSQFDAMDNYDIYRYLYNHESTIPIFIKYIPEVVIKIGQDFIGRLMSFSPQYADELQKLI